LFTKVNNLVRCILWSGKIKNVTGGHGRFGDRKSAYKALVEKLGGRISSGMTGLTLRIIQD
jgi:hypothetical protein